MSSDLIYNLKHTRPLIIAGPCSIESREQLFSTARALQEIKQVQALRVGVWKPRTQPGMFEGLGEEALLWLRELKQEFALPILTEVANREQAEMALDAGLDGLWIGARTSVNPFALEPLFATIATRNSQLPVFIKNPLAADLQLWIGAVLRAKKAGLQNLALIYRGVACYPKYANLRAEPNWDLALEMRVNFPDLPMLLDPSHMAGKCELLLPLIFASKNYQLDGLIIESHIDPKQALTDKAQQVSPTQLTELLDYYLHENSSVVEKAMLENYRLLIDVLDQRLADILAQRMQIVEQIAQIKKRQNIPLLQEKRYAQIREKWHTYAEGKNMDLDFFQALFELIHQESLQRQAGLTHNYSVIIKGQNL